jgi:hypothetical protein
MNTISESTIREALHGKEFVFWGKKVNSVLFEIKVTPSSNLYHLYEGGEKVYTNHSVGAVVKAYNLRLVGEFPQLGV